MRGENLPNEKLSSLLFHLASFSRHLKLNFFRKPQQLENLRNKELTITNEFQPVEYTLKKKNSSNQREKTPALTWQGQERFRFKSFVLDLP